MVKIKENVNYRLLSFEAGTYLTLSGAGLVSAVGHAYVNEPTQTWTFTGVSGEKNTYFIKSVDTGKYLAVPKDRVVPGQQLEAGTTPFEWRVVDEPNSAVAARMTPVAPADLYIDLYNANPDNGAPVQLYQTKTIQIKQGLVWVWVQAQ